DELLLNVVGHMTGKRVFNAALTGADPVDFLKAAKLLEKNGTKDKVVILDVMPTRFFTKKHLDPPAGNYPGEFANRVGDNWFMDKLVNLRRPLLILDRDLLIQTLFHRTQFAGGEYRNSVWDRNDLARERFDTFQAEVTDLDAVCNFDWVAEIRAVLK